MKIDYDELRKKVEAVEDAKRAGNEATFHGSALGDALAIFHRQATPGVILRLLEIIDVAKGALRNARQCHCIDGNPRRDCPAVITQKAFVEIAKLENGE